jgi:hypothetical protein
VKAALIGAGQIARQHLTCLKTLRGVELAAICDLSPATAEAAAERYGIGAWFTDHRTLGRLFRRCLSVLYHCRPKIAQRLLAAISMPLEPR